ARSLAQQHNASISVITGEELLNANYPLIHTVGRASARAPRLIDVVWGETQHPRVTLIGKGVCFDTGGLDLKTAAGMVTMKKDMGGAARAATGMELPPFFTDDDTLSDALLQNAREQHDPLWRLPLWRSYETAIDSTIADVNNAPEYSLAGAITAALFLDRFVSNCKSWAHFDIPAWTDRPKPGRRRGAEANGIRAMYGVVAQRFGRG